MAISCKNFVNFCLVTAEKNGAHLRTSGTTRSKKQAYFVEYLQTYWTDFCNIFTIWKRFTCRWWICTLFSNLSRDVAIATKYCCSTEGKLIVRAFFARSPDGSKVLFRYCLLGGDTAAPRGLFAGLCHAFQVLFYFTWERGINVFDWFWWNMVTWRTLAIPTILINKEYWVWSD